MRAKCALTASKAACISARIRSWCGIVAGSAGMPIPAASRGGRVAVERYERDQGGPAVAVNDRVGDQGRLPQFLFDLQRDCALAGQVSRDDASRDSASWRARQIRRC